jgi:hypothetical protein
VSSVIFVVIIGMWAVVLIPMWLRSHDATSETRSVDRFSTAMRSLSRRPAGAGEYVGPRSRDVLVPRRTSTAQFSGGRAPTTVARRARAAQLQQMRRRRSALIGLLGFLAVVLVATAAGAAPAWLPVLTLAGTGAYIYHLRIQTVRERMAARPAARAARTERGASDETATPVDARFDPVRPAPRYVRRPARRPALGSQALADELDAVGDLDGTWDDEWSDQAWTPVAAVVPTYVTAPPATSVPRAIDRAQAGAWDARQMLEHATAAGTPDPDEIFDGRDASGELQETAEVGYPDHATAHEAVAATVAGSTAQPFLQDDVIFDQETEDEEFLDFLDRRASGS